MDVETCGGMAEVHDVSDEQPTRRSDWLRLSLISFCIWSPPLAELSLGVHCRYTL